jgi:hypothetical protein
MITAVLLLVITGIDPANRTIAKKYKAQTIRQVNNCGNYVSPTNVTYSNFGLNPEGHESVNKHKYSESLGSAVSLKHLGKLHTLIRYWHNIAPDELWIVEANLNISNHNIIVILTDTMISIGHDLVGQHYEHLFYRQCTDHLKHSLCPNIPAKLSSLFHNYPERR